MDQHAVTLLEFAAVRAELAELCLSPAGAARLAGEPFVRDAAAHEVLLSEVGAVRALLEADRLPPDADLPEVADALAALAKEGAVLEPDAAARLGRFLDTAGKLRRALRPRGRNDAALERVAPLLAAADGVAELPPAIFRVVEPDGTIRERQIPSLAAIRSRIRRLEREVELTARRYLTAPEYRPLLNGDRATERGGRTVLPVKAGQQGRIRGVVHEVSSSGATVFVEPEESVRAGHRVAAEELAYRRELRRVMRELTARVAAREAEVRAAVAAVACYDGRYARARYARLHRCAALQRCTGGIDLRAARHPLLGPAAVPIDLRWGGGRRVLIITGPNTGGKTVALKTVGLLALMNQFGMQVPAASGSALPLFDQVLCDIGDEQSIAQSLSTFSGHVRQLAHILNHAGERSLVLLDELGAGTDPEEGVTLAMAVLDRLIERGALAAASTHHGALKNYGYANAAVENAAMEFDLQSLRPTYRLLLGIPGESHALEIARRQGMPAPVIAAARGYLAEGRSDAGEIIRSLTARQHELRGVAEGQRRAADELESRRREAAARERELAARERELQAAEAREVRAFLSSSRRQLEAAIRQLREQGRDGEGWRGAAAAARAVVEQVAERAAQAAGNAASPPPASVVPPDPAGRAGRAEQAEAGAPPRPAQAPVPVAGELAPGARVRIAGSGREGVVLRAGRRGAWEVETGSVRGTFRATELQLVGEPAAGRSGRRPPPTPQVEVTASAARPRLELNVRGQRLHEALAAVERQLDGALLGGLQQFTILHGTGEGVLRHGIHEYLERHRAVAGFDLAAPQEGGAGKTVVRLA